MNNEELQLWDDNAEVDSPIEIEDGNDAFDQTDPLDDDPNTTSNDDNPSDSDGDEPGDESNKSSEEGEEPKEQEGTDDPGESGGEQEEEPGDPAEEKETNALSVYYNHLKTIGVLLEEEGAEPFTGTEEDLEERIRKSDELKQNQLLVGLFDHLNPNPEGLAYLQFFLQGGTNIEDFLAQKQSNTILDYENIDLQDENTQRTVIAKALRSSGMPEDKIKAKIQKYEDLGMLEDEATDAIEIVKEQESKAKEQVLAQTKAQREQAKKMEQENIKLLRDVISSKDEIKGFPITKKDKEQFFDFIYKTQKTDQGEVTGFNAKLTEALNDPEKFVLLANLLKNDFDVKAINTKKATEATKGLKKTLSELSNTDNKASVTSRGSGRSDINFDLSKAKLG